MIVIRHLVIVILIPAIFAIMGFFYSFFGLIHPIAETYQLETFRALSIKEIGGHFVFGFIAGLVSRNLKISIICGLMAVTIDADHVLNVLAIHIPPRTDHSILFAAISSILIGFFAVKLRKILQTDKMSLRSDLGTIQHWKNDTLFSQFLFMTLGIFLSHIAYDVTVDNNARFPFLTPFSFNDFKIPQIYGSVLEAVSVLVIYCSNKYLTRSKSGEGVNINHKAN